MVWFGLVASSDLRPTLVVPRHPSLQSTRTRRPGGRKRRQCIRIYTIPPVHHLQYPILWTKPTMRTLQQLPSFKGRPTRLGRATLQFATAGNCSSHRKRALRQTCSRDDPDNTICVQKTQTERSTVGSCQWFGSASWPFKAPHQFSGLDKKTMALALGRDSSLT